MIQGRSSKDVDQTFLSTNFNALSCDRNFRTEIYFIYSQTPFIKTLGVGDGGGGIGSVRINGVSLLSGFRV